MPGTGTVGWIWWPVNNLSEPELEWLPNSTLSSMTYMYSAQLDNLVSVSQA
jgi:hypothetical protein